MTQRARLPLGRFAIAILAALLASAPAAAQDQGRSVFSRAPATVPAIGSTIAGRVLAWPDSLPISGAMITVESIGKSALASRDGYFQIGGLPPGTHTILVRQVGFRPTTLTVRVMGLAEVPSGEGRYAITLTRLPALLDAVVVRHRSTGDPCRSAGFRGDIADARVAPILEQLEANVDRMRDLGTRFPLEYRVARMRHLKVETGAMVAQRTDTVLRRTDVRWPYATGKVLETRLIGDRAVPGREMHVPGVVDLADPAFQSSHCFRYAGVERRDGRLLHRIDFAPLDILPTSDVAGSLWLDVENWLLARSTFRLTRVPPRMRVRAVEVTAEYREARPGLVVPQALLTVETVQGVKVGGAKVTEFLQRDHVVAWRWVGAEEIGEERKAAR